MGLRIGRVIKLQIGDITINTIDAPQAFPDQLGVSFQVSKSTNRQPNKAKITVLNLNAETRASITTEGTIPIALAAGYRSDNSGLIFQGNMRFSDVTNNGTNWVSTLEAGDGAKANKKARINKAFKTAKPADMLREVAKTLEAEGIGLGNLEEKISEGGIVPGLNDFLGGVVLSGKSSDIFTTLVTSLGYEWSIQNEQIQILRPNEKIQVVGLGRLTPESGLIGSPRVGKEGLIKYRQLLDSRINPGVSQQLLASNVDGEYRVEKADFLGDTWGNDWFVDVEAKELKP